MALLLVFICLLLGIAYGIAVGIIALAIIISVLLGLLNYYHLHRHGHIPKFIKYATAVLITAFVVAIATVGFVLDVISDFEVFTILMAIVIVGFFLVYLLMNYAKKSK